MEKSNRTTVDPPEPGITPASSYVPPIDDAELVRRNQPAMRLLDAWEQDEDSAEDQRETMAVLREAFGERRIASARSLFP